MNTSINEHERICTFQQQIKSVRKIAELDNISVRSNQMYEIFAFMQPQGTKNNEN